MRKIPVFIEKGTTVALSPGGQNVLVEHVVNDFARRFTPGGKIVYVGDTGDKFAYFDAPYLTGLGVRIEAHGKMPDVIIHHLTRTGSYSSRLLHLMDQLIRSAEVNSWLSLPARRRV